MQELVELNEIRLNEQLSYEKLAESIKELTGFAIRGATLHRLLNETRRKPYDRTLHIIRRYLEARRSRRRRVSS